MMRVRNYLYSPIRVWLKRMMFACSDSFVLYLARRVSPVREPKSSKSFNRVKSISFHDFIQLGLEKELQLLHAAEDDFGMVSPGS
jgi:hypothetical protein